MARTVHRSDVVLRADGSSSTLPRFGAGYTVTAYEVGGQVTAFATSTTINLHTGHGFAANDKLIVFRAGQTPTELREVQSTGANSVVLDQALTVQAGDFLVNLGPDTSSSGEPNYDGSGRTIYSDMAAVTTITQSRVTADSTSSYSYWYTSNEEIWELVRDTLGVPVALKIRSGVDAT